MAAVQPASPRRLAVFGGYSDHDFYQRNRVLVRLLRDLVGETIEIRPQRPGSGHVFGAHVSFSERLGLMIRDCAALWSRRRELRQCDVVFVPYPAYLDLLLLRFIGADKSQRIIADAFLALASTVVDDRRLLRPRSLPARLLHLFQRLTLGKADLLLIDTPQQARRLLDELGSRAPPIMAVPVGIDEELWQPLAPREPIGPCQVLFWGTFIPLHGVEHILCAARILADAGESFAFTLIGDGQMAPAIAASIASRPLLNLRWDRRLVDTRQLHSALAQSDIVLGVFGDSEKAGDVVPYKVHQALASNKPVITRLGSAVQSALAPEAGFVGCPPADGAALAEALTMMRDRLAMGWRAETRQVFDRYFGKRVVREALASALRTAAQ